MDKSTKLTITIGNNVHETTAGDMLSELCSWDHDVMADYGQPGCINARIARSYGLSEVWAIAFADWVAELRIAERSRIAVAR